MSYLLLLFFSCLVTLESSENRTAVTFEQAQTSKAFSNRTPLVSSGKILVMKDEIQLGEKITRPNANSDFTKAFSSRSIKDSKGRSLRDLKFNKTIFKYSCSYMIYSKSFVSLPEVLKNAVFKRIKDILLKDIAKEKSIKPIVLGMTISEVENIMGKPKEIISQSNSNENMLWIYSYDKKTTISGIYVEPQAMLF